MKILQSFHKCHTQFPCSEHLSLVWCSCHNSWTYTDTSLLAEVCTLLIVPQSFPCALLLFQDPVQDTTFSPHVSSSLGQFLKLSFKKIFLTAWEILVRYFLESSSVWVCLMFFSWLDRVMITSRKGTCCPQAFTTNVVNLDHLAEVVFLSIIKILYSPPSILFSLGGSYCTQSIFEGWGGVMAPSSWSA